MGRLARTLEHILATARDFEVIVVDWSSEKPVSEVMRLRLPRTGKIRFLYVPNAVSANLKTRFSEVHALNLAVRRSNGVFFGRIDQDTLVGRRFVSWAERDLMPDDPRAYFSGRRGLSPDAKQIDENAPQWSQMNAYAYFLAAVGILLAPRALWHRTRGYDETLCFMNHMEHDLCLRLNAVAGLQNLGLMLNGDFYHQWHEPAQGVQNNPMRAIRPLRLQAARKHFVNDDSWGLSNFRDEIVEDRL
jgi:hypothetical protein